MDNSGFMNINIYYNILKCLNYDELIIRWVMVSCKSINSFGWLNVFEVIFIDFRKIYIWYNV